MVKRNRNRVRGANRRVVDGLLPLDKPVGPTSNGILQHVKRLFNARKAGHTGSLDPLATGVLPLCFGQATKLSAYLLDADKVYTVTAQLGVKTDTADADGKVIDESAHAELSRDVLEAALSRFRGQIEQVPPMYSALKRDGKRLYEIAREGREVRREPRVVTILQLDIEHFDPLRPVLRVHCSKGTYIRTLIEDIAAAAGTLGHVAALRRLAVYPFQEEDLVTIDELEAAVKVGPAALDRYLLPVDRALANWPAVYLNHDASYYLLQGQSVNNGAGANPGLVRVYDENRRFLAVGELLPDGRVAPRRLFVESGSGAS